MSPKFDLVIVNGLIVTASDLIRGCIGVKDGKIVSIAGEYTENELNGAEIIDAGGAHVMPGGVDAHVHLCQDMQSGPHGLGGRCADDFETGSKSAIAGGTTTIITFAAQTRSSDPDNKSLIKVVENHRKQAESTGSYADYGCHVIIVRNDKEILETELKTLVEEYGVTSVKLFMTYERQRLADRDLLDVMLAARKFEVTTMIHAENGDMIEWLTEKLEERGMIAPYYHALSRPPAVEVEATNRAIAMAELIHNPILFVHVGSTGGMNNVRSAQTRGLPIYAETCPQYLNLTWDDLRRFHSPTCFENSKMICSPPPPPDASEKDALYRGIANGTFTIFSSDHCPFRYDDPLGKPTGIIEPENLDVKEYPAGGQEIQKIAKEKTGAFRFVPNGIPGVETRLPLLYTGGIVEGIVTPQKFVEVTATNPAKLYGLYPRKGTLSPGSDADIVIWHPQDSFAPFEIRNDRLHHNVDYTPYEGKVVRNWPKYTILRGQVVYRGGQITGQVRCGQYLKRGPSQLTRGFPKPVDSHHRTATWLL